MRRLLIAVLVVGCIAFYPSATRASFCVVPDVSESFKVGRAVFLGEATDIVEPVTANEDTPLADRAYTIKFKVLQSWKGVPFGAAQFSILWLTNCYECPALPGMNERYLVYANPVGESSSLVTGCSRTMVVQGDPRTGVKNSNGLVLVHTNGFDPYLDMKQLDIITKRAFTIKVGP